MFKQIKIAVKPLFFIQDKNDNFKVRKSFAFDNISEKFDVILSNPPIRAGKQTIFQIYEKSFEHLNENGEFYCVIQTKHGAKSTQKKLEEVLGIMLFMEDENKNFKNNDKLTGNLIELLIKLRADARKEKNFKLSDEMRDNLKELGIEIQDNKDGTTGYTIQSNNNEI